MSESKAGARPQQVTMAGWVSVVGCALLVVILFDSMSSLRSIEMRNALRDLVSTPPVNDMGITVPEAIDFLRVATLVAGAAAAAATVLAVYVLRRHNPARVGFTVAAAAILLTAPVAGAILPVLIAYAAAMLWTRPARDWFAGRDPAPAGSFGRGRHVQDRHEQGRHAQGRATDSQNGTLMSENDSPQQPPHPPPSGEQWPPPGQSGPGAQQWPHMPDAEHGPGRQMPPPTQGFGSPHPQPWPGGHMQYPPPHQAPYPGMGQPTGRRPATVAIAAAVTWLCTGLTALAYVIVIGMLIGDRAQLVRLIERYLRDHPEVDVSTNQLIGVLWVMSVVVVLWCVIAMVLAFFAYRGANWARISLVVSCAVTVVVGLVTFRAVVGVVYLLTAAAVIVLLFTGGANEWYSRGRAPRGYASYPPPPGPYGAPQGPYGGPPPGGPPPGGQYPGQPQPPYGEPGQHYGQQGGEPYGGQGGGPYGGQGGGPGRDEPPDEGKKEPPKNVW